LADREATELTLMMFTMTAAPSLATSSAMAAPIPFDAPLTAATFLHIDILTTVYLMQGIDPIQRLWRLLVIRRRISGRYSAQTLRPMR